MLSLFAALAPALALQTAAPTIAPDGGRLSEGSQCFTLNMNRDGASQPVGVAWQTVRRETIGGRAILRIVVHQSVNAGAFDMRDEFLLDAASLGPIALENTRKGQVHVRVRYEPDRIVGETIDAGVSTPIDLPLTGPVWEGNLYGLTFAALPLAPDAAFTLPYWQYDKGFGEFTVRVTGTETVATPEGPVEAWVIDAGANAETRSTYLISRADHRELGYRAGPGSQALGGDCSALETAP